MKLQTSIKPRMDGTVLVDGKDGQLYTFEQDASGDLTGDIEHEETVAHLLAGGLFYPADPADFEAAVALAATVNPPVEPEVDGADEKEDDVDLTAMPIEGNTPPSTNPPRKAE